MKRVAPSKMLLLLTPFLTMSPYVFFALYLHQNLFIILILNIIATLGFCLGYTTFCYNNLHLKIQNSYINLFNFSIFSDTFIISKIKKITIKDVGERGGATIFITCDGKNYKYSFGIITNRKGFSEMLDFLKKRIPDFEIIGTVWQ